MRISQTILDYVLEHREGVLTSDAREDERWDPAASILKLGVREAICVPMQGRYGMVGVIYIDTYTPPGQVVQNRHVNRFSDEHLKLMVAIGHQAALAVEDTSYYSALVQAERLAAVGQTIATLVAPHQKHSAGHPRRQLPDRRRAEEHRYRADPQGLEHRQQEPGEDLQPGDGHVDVQQGAAAGKSAGQPESGGRRR